MGVCFPCNITGKLWIVPYPLYAMNCMIGLREQKSYFVTMGTQSAHWALLRADLFYGTGDIPYKNRAVQTLNFLTCHLQPDERLLVGVDYKHESGGWAFNQFWFSCHLSSDLYLMEFLDAFPEYALRYY